MSDSEPSVKPEVTEVISGEEVEKLLGELCGDDGSSVCERFLADDCALVHRVLNFVTSSSEDEQHVIGERCLCTVLLCSSPEQHTVLANTLVKAGALQKWIYADLQGHDMASACAALDFLTLLCAVETCMPKDITSLFDRNLVCLLLDTMIDTEGIVARDESFSTMCRSALLAFCAVSHQIYMEDASENKDEDPIERRLAMNRALSVILLHPKTEDGTLSQIFVKFANRCLVGLNSLLFGVFCWFIADVCSCSAVAYSVLFDQDLSVLASILVKDLEDSDPCSPDPRRAAALKAVGRIFNERSMRYDMKAEVTHLNGTLVWLTESYGDSQIVEKAREVLAIINA